MASKKPLVVGIVIAVLIAVASLTAYATAYQRPQQYQQPWSSWGMMGGLQGSNPSYQNPASPYYGPGGMMGGMTGGMMGSWNGYGTTGNGNGNGYGAHCPMMNAFYGKEYNATTGYNTVVIFNYAFYPDTLTVKKGTTVTWINMDWVVHTVESGTHDKPLELFDSGELGHMGTFSYTFNEVGTYKYHCDPHPEMEGTIIVEA